MRRLTYTCLFAVRYVTPWALARLRRTRRTSQFGTLTTTWVTTGPDRG